MLSILDARNCAIHYKTEFIDKYYIVVTNTNKRIVLKAEPKQFPHLIGIRKRDYVSNRMTGEDVYNLLINPHSSVPATIIPNSIAESSKRGRKIKNFTKLDNMLFKSSSTLCIVYNPVLNNLKLNNVTYLFSDYLNGFSSGWIYNAITNNCQPTTWIDESEGKPKAKQKYYQKQNVELVKSIETYDSTGKLLENYIVKRKFHHYLLIRFICLINRCKFIK